MGFDVILQNRPINMMFEAMTATIKTTVYRNVTWCSLVPMCQDIMPPLSGKTENLPSREGQKIFSET